MGYNDLYNCGCFFTNVIIPTVYNDALTYLEKANRLFYLYNELAAWLNKLNMSLQDFEKYVKDTFVTKDDLKNNRHLDENGNFTGCLDGYSVTCVIEAIAESLSLSKRLIDQINNRDAIGFAIKGQTWFDNTPLPNPDRVFTGSKWFENTHIIVYNENCIRDDFTKGGL